MNYSFPHFLFNKRNSKIILSVIALYLLFLIINIPASVVLSLASLPNNITLTSVSGTLWSGNIRKLNYSGIDLGTVNWELHPLNLIIGELSADVSIVRDEQYINAEVVLSPSGKIELEEMRFLVDLSSLQPLTYGMPFSYAGMASGYFPSAFFHKNNYVGINGKLSLTDIAMISPQAQSFGSFVVAFREENEGATSGLIKDKGGILSLSGQLKLNKKGRFTLSARLAAREKGSPLEKVISFLGKKDASGRVVLNNNFNLWR